MSLIRLSVMGSTAYAPLPDGTMILHDYQPHALAGKMERLDEPALADENSNLYHYLSHRIGEATGKLDDDAPVVVMVHGFLFDPRFAISPEPRDTDNPHGRLYHFIETDEEYDIRHHTSSWPMGLGFSEEDATGKEGLAIAFGWHSLPGFASSLIAHHQNFYARAYDNAAGAGWVLANLLAHLQRLLPGKKIDLFCHSLGSRVVIRALSSLTQHAPHALQPIDRVLLLGGAEYVVEAQLMMRRLAALPNLTCSFYNMVSRENDVLDKLGEHFGPRTFGNTQVIGHNGLDVRHPGERWIDLQLDSRRLQRWMENRNLFISGDRPHNIWDHWYYYTYRGNMNLYRHMLRKRAQWHIPTLRREGMPDRVSRRWSIFGD